jgi:uncharacterized BrkB/YihY/UPF0761 family membrane protein
MNSYAFTSLTPVWCEVNDFFILSFCLSLLLFFFFFFVIFLVLVIQSDLERIFKSCETISHCKHVIIVKDYGKVGILCAENFGGFILRKKKDPPSQKGNAGLLFVMHMMC